MLLPSINVDRKERVLTLYEGKLVVRIHLGTKPNDQVISTIAGVHFNGLTVRCGKTYPLQGKCTVADSGFIRRQGAIAKVGVPTYYSAKFPDKLHENEKTFQ